MGLGDLDEVPKRSPSRSRVSSSPSRVSELVVEKEFNVYQNLAALVPDPTRKIIQFIGSREGEGTSTVVREFARVSALKFGKLVLLLDADYHHPSQHLFFNIQPEFGWQDVSHRRRSILSLADNVRAKILRYAQNDSEKVCQECLEEI